MDILLKPLLAQKPVANNQQHAHINSMRPDILPTFRSKQNPNIAQSSQRPASHHNSKRSSFPQEAQSEKHQSGCCVAARNCRGEERVSGISERNAEEMGDCEMVSGMSIWKGQ